MLDLTTTDLPNLAYSAAAAAALGSAFFYRTSSSGKDAFKEREQPVKEYRQR
jgi:hypothetical protein